MMGNELMALVNERNALRLERHELMDENKRLKALLKRMAARLDHLESLVNRDPAETDRRQAVSAVWSGDWDQLAAHGPEISRMLTEQVWMASMEAELPRLHPVDGEISEGEPEDDRHTQEAPERRLHGRQGRGDSPGGQPPQVPVDMEAIEEVGRRRAARDEPNPRSGGPAEGEQEELGEAAAPGDA